jgi:hypothetical protein
MSDGEEWVTDGSPEDASAVVVANCAAVVVADCDGGGDGKYAKKVAPSLPPMLFNSKLTDVELTAVLLGDGTPKNDPDTGAKIMKARKVAGVDLDKLKVEMLRVLCRHYGIKKYRSKKKDDLLILIAQVQQTHAAYNALDDNETTKAQKKENDKVRMANLLFSSDFYEEAITMNDKKSRKELDKGGAGYSKSVLVDMSLSFSDTLNNDIYGEVLFQENPHIANAISEGLDPSRFNEHNWVSLLALLKEIWKDYDKSILNFTKSGRHEHDLYGDGFTKTVSTYYYHLHVQDKPESHKAYSSLIDEDIFAEAGLVKKGKAKSKSSSNMKDSRNVNKEESMKRVATAAFEPIQEEQRRIAARNEQYMLSRQQDQRRLAARNELYTIDRLIPEALEKMDDHMPGTPIYEHYNESLNSMVGRKKELKKKLEENPSPAAKEKK